VNDTTITYALMRVGPPRTRLDLASFARAANTHPDLVRRLVELGLLEPERDRAGELWFAPEQLGTFARISRLRAGLGLNYAAVGLVLDLLDRIDDLNRQLRRAGG
jgi:DNA-binding transcriptional MerR regulator